MKHFCFLTGLYSRQDPLMVDRQGRCLVDAGFNVSYVICDDKQNETVGGIQFISTGYTSKNRIERFFRTKKVVLDTAYKVDADIYQISDPELIKLIIPLKRKGKKVVFNLREYYPDLILHKTYIPKLLRRIVARYYSYLMTKYLPQYDAVFTVTPQVVSFLNTKHNVDDAYLVTNYPIPSTSFKLSKEDYLKRPDTLLYEGSIYSISRQEIVFDALSEVPQLRYVLAGIIEQGYEWIKEHPYWESLTFVDGFKKEALRDLFNGATISNVLRDWGSMDGSLGVIKLFESMEAGLPVLLSDVPLYRNLISKYKCGLCVNPNDSNDIKKALEYLVENKEDAYRMGQNGRQAVLDEFNWNKQAEKYLLVINNIIGIQS